MFVIPQHISELVTTVVICNNLQIYPMLTEKIQVKDINQAIHIMENSLKGTWMQYAYINTQPKTKNAYDFRSVTSCQTLLTLGEK